MYISHLRIENFRNFAEMDVELAENAVIVGANRTGKSNLIHALRLVLDPSLPDTSRQLKEEDFWDGLDRPLSDQDRITISVDIVGFDNDDNVLAVLGDYLVSSDPHVARLTYVFQQSASAGRDGATEPSCEFLTYGGDQVERRFGYDLRKRIRLDVLEALRDAESDLGAWSRSPLRLLLDDASERIEDADVEAIAEAVSDATEKITDISEIQALSERIVQRVRTLAGTDQAFETTFGFSPTDPGRLLRALRLFIDGGRRGIDGASLGSANVLYLALKSLELDARTVDGERDHTILAIEEPEAHLHPHLQRLVYGSLLRPQETEADGEEDEPGDGPRRSLLLTTHSPHIASVAPINSLVILRKQDESGVDETRAVSAASIEFSKAERADIERYLDVTRGEMLFARRVILVEGDAEVYVLPVLAKKLGMDLDELGVTVCSVGGTHFGVYVKFLHGMGTKFAVVTDGDPRRDGTKVGQQRVGKLANLLTTGKSSTEEKTRRVRPADLGLFAGDETFEIDLFRSGRHGSMMAALSSLGRSEASRKRATEWLEDPEEVDCVQLVKDIETIGKGRFAQRLATEITRRKGKPCPKYVKEALEYVTNED